jgi:hypothetical protein
MASGTASLKKIIYLALSLYAVAFVMPGALYTLASQTFTSVNAGVVQIFTTLISLVVGFVIILLFIESVRG